MYRCEQQIFPFVMADLRHCTLSEAKKVRYVRLDVPLSSHGTILPSMFSPFPILVKMGGSSHGIIISLASDSGHCPNFSHGCGHIPSSESFKVCISSPVCSPNILVNPTTTVCKNCPHLTLARHFSQGLKESTAWCWTHLHLLPVLCGGGGYPPLPKMRSWHDEVWPKCYGRNLFHSPYFVNLFCRGLACFWEMIEQRFPTFVPWRNLNHCIWKHLQAIKSWWQRACLLPLVGSFVPVMKWTHTWYKLIKMKRRLVVYKDCLILGIVREISVVCGRMFGIFCCIS